MRATSANLPLAPSSSTSDACIRPTDDQLNGISLVNFKKLLDEYDTHIHSTIEQNNMNKSRQFTSQLLTKQRNIEKGHNYDPSDPVDRFEDIVTPPSQVLSTSTLAVPEEVGQNYDRSKSHQTTLTRLSQSIDANHVPFAMTKLEALDGLEQRNRALKQAYVAKQQRLDALLGKDSDSTYAVPKSKKGSSSRGTSRRDDNNQGSPATPRQRLHFDQGDFFYNASSSQTATGSLDLEADDDNGGEFLRVPQTLTPTTAAAAEQNGSDRDRNDSLPNTTAALTRQRPATASSVRNQPYSDNTYSKLKSEIPLATTKSLVLPLVDASYSAFPAQDPRRPYTALGRPSTGTRGDTLNDPTPPSRHAGKRLHPKPLSVVGEYELLHHDGDDICFEGPLPSKLPFNPSLASYQSMSSLYYDRLEENDQKQMTREYEGDAARDAAIRHQKRMARYELTQRTLEKLNRTNDEDLLLREVRMYIAYTLVYV